MAEKIVLKLPTVEQLYEMDDNMDGWCVRCGETQHGCEPDAEKYECECCGKRSVYGPGILAMMGLVSP